MFKIREENLALLCPSVCDTNQFQNQLGCPVAWAQLQLAEPWHQRAEATPLLPGRAVFTVYSKCNNTERVPYTDCTKSDTALPVRSSVTNLSSVKLIRLKVLTKDIRNDRHLDNTFAMFRWEIYFTCWVKDLKELTASVQLKGEMSLLSRCASSKTQRLAKYHKTWKCRIGPTNVFNCTYLNITVAT